MSRPIEKLKSGSVSCAVWQNDSGMKSVTFQHSYKDKNTNEWKNTEFIPDYKLPDLLSLVTALTIKSVLAPDVKKPIQTGMERDTVPSADSATVRTDEIARKLEEDSHIMTGDLPF